MTLPYGKAVFEANEACLLCIDYRLARRSSSSLAAVLEATTDGKGFGTTSVASMER
jgi:hypothetical protein